MIWADIANALISSRRFFVHSTPGQFVTLVVSGCTQCFKSTSKLNYLIIELEIGMTFVKNLPEVIHTYAYAFTHPLFILLVEHLRICLLVTIVYDGMRLNIVKFFCYLKDPFVCKWHHKALDVMAKISGSGNGLAPVIRQATAGPSAESLFKSLFRSAAKREEVKAVLFVRYSQKGNKHSYFC